MDLLPLEAAAEVAGVPAAQLKLWAWDRVGPRNVGTRTKPLYDQRDLEEWKKSHVETLQHKVWIP